MRRRKVWRFSLRIITSLDKKARRDAGFLHLAVRFSLRSQIISARINNFEALKRRRNIAKLARNLENKSGRDHE
jgi:hypothetical protein